MGPEGYSDHPLGWTPRPPQAGVPDSWTMMPPHGPRRMLRPPPGVDSPSPPGRCAQFLDDAAFPWAPKDTLTTPEAGLPVPPKAGLPGSSTMMPPHGPKRILRPPPGLDSPSPPGRCARFLDDAAFPWALKDTPTTPWAGLPVPPRPVCPVLGRCCLPIGPEGYSDHPLGRTPRPSYPGVPGSWTMMLPHVPWRILRPPPRLDSPSPPGRCARFLDEAASPWALKDAPTTPPSRLPVHPRPVCLVLG